MGSRVFELIEKEAARQRENVELIASENFVSEDVLRAVGSCLTNKYSEGYAAQRVSGNKGRYYGGCECVDELEEYCCQKWKEVFQTDYHVNVQPHSGSQANMAAYLSVLTPGDCILAMDLNNGGHLTHGSPVNFSGKLFDVRFYDVDGRGYIDMENVQDSWGTGQYKVEMKVSEVCNINRKYYQSADGKDNKEWKKEWAKIKGRKRQPSVWQQLLGVVSTQYKDSKWVTVLTDPAKSAFIQYETDGIKQLLNSAPAAAPQGAPQGQQGNSQKKK